MAWCDVVEPRTLRECRIALGQSQAAFAAMLGASPESYRTWDAGRRAPAASLRPDYAAGVPPGPGRARVRRRRPARRRVCHDRGPVRTPVACARAAAHRRAVSGHCRPRPRAGAGGPCPPYAVPRRTRRRGDAVRGAAGPAAWDRRRAGTACACCARYSTSWSPASSSSCSLMML